MLTLRALLDAPASGLHLIYARPEQLDRDIPSAFLTDLPDPSPFLKRDGMVLSSGIWARVEGGVDSFVSALARAGAGSLVLGLVDLGVLPEAIIAACKGSDLPLIVTDDDVLYSEIAQQIEDAADPDGASLLASVLQFSRTVSSSSAVPALIGAFETAFGITAAVIQHGGLVIRQSGDALTLDSVAAACLDIDRFGARSASFEANDRTWTLIPLNSGAQSEGALAIAREDALSGAMSIAASAACAVARALVLQEDAAKATERSAGNDLLEPGIDTSAMERAVRFRIAGGVPGDRIVVVRASVDATAPSSETILELITQVFSPDRAPIARIDGAALTVIIRINAAGLIDQHVARSRLHDLSSVLGGRDLRIGVSDPFVDLGRLSGAAAQALSRHDSLVGTGVMIASTSSVENHHALLAGLSADALADYANVILAPLLEYDRRADAQLIETLRAFLSHLGRWQDAADALHVHPNTLRYRIRRIESLTGRALSDVATWVDYQLAVEQLDRR